MTKTIWLVALSPDSHAYKAHPGALEGEFQGFRVLSSQALTVDYPFLRVTMGKPKPGNPSIVPESLLIPAQDVLFAVEIEDRAELALVRK